MDADDPPHPSGTSTPASTSPTPEPELLDPADDASAAPTPEGDMSAAHAALDKLHISPQAGSGESLHNGSPVDAAKSSNDEEELERFRKEWQAEVKLKARRDDKAKDGSALPGAGEGSVVPPAPRLTADLAPQTHPSDLDNAAQPPGAADEWAGPRTQAEETANKYALFPDRRRGRAGRYPVPGSSASASTSHSKGHRDVASFPKTGRALPKPDEGTGRDQAVRLYTRAVESEQSGKLNDALQLYRQAFKLDDLVDRHYAQLIKASAEPAVPKENNSAAPSSADIVSPTAPRDEPYSFQRHIQIQPDYAPPPPAAVAVVVPSDDISAEPSATALPDPPVRPSPLSRLLEACPLPVSETAFLPADEALPLPIARLPSEMMDHVLRHLDVASIERLAQTCWRARYLTSSSVVWKRFAEGLYKAPTMVPPEPRWGAKELVRRHRGEWRTMLIEEERVRMDGCYISVCHYIRPGAGDQWVAITHMITYHRFLRFYPDGSCISFLTTDHPSEVVPHLRPSLRGKGLHLGRWHLIRSDHPDNPPAEPSLTGRRRARIVITDLLEPGAETPKYEFEMELHLRETGRGRWNKLDMLSYNSIHLGSGETLGLSLKNQKPFYFSKVKSYNPQL